MNNRLRLLLLFWCSSIFLASAQHLPVNPVLLQKQWPAAWITCPDAPQRDYGVYHFRKTFTLPDKPGKYLVHVSADNRYRLFVNGQAVVSGPARGDLYNWYFETVDLAPFLKSGTNLISALVWNMGEHAPVAQISNRTALVVQGDTEAEKAVNTDRSWKVFKNNAYTPTSLDNGPRLRTYMVIGPGDDVQAAAYPWNWEKPEFDDTRWANARPITNPVTAGNGTDNLWTLAPRNIPLMPETLQRLQAVRRTSGVSANKGFLTGKSPLVIPANTKAVILLDQSFNTVAYPELLTSGGKGAEVKMTYAEALFNNYKKGNRNEIEGKEIMGNYDTFRPDGGAQRRFRPLWLRTYRYLQLDVQTQAEPLTLHDLYGYATGYPFEEKARFSANDASLQQIWRVGWHTAKLCAGETYYDCPYYEQLQYEGDTRIQALISLYVSGDDRLMRKAIQDFYYSRVPEGLTQGRYPSNRLQVIPPFSLYWVSMLYDYWMHRPDEKFVQQYLHAMQGILGWYENHLDRQKQMLGPMPWWNFTDWDTTFDNGVPEGANDGNSSVITLQYAYTLRQAAQLLRHFQQPAVAARYEELAGQLAQATYARCFDPGKNALANTPEKKSYSQHASIMGILAGAVPTARQKAVMQTILTDKSLSQATFFYRFYLTQALKEAGLADLYYSQLTPWRDMLQIGLTTFAENPEPTRSDCHAWSSSPNYDFLATICGIMPAKPGFAAVRIAPALGELQQVKGAMPHPAGEIQVSLQRKGKTGISGEVTLPASLTGTFVWNNQSITLQGGKQKINL